MERKDIEGGVLLNQMKVSNKTSTSIGGKSLFINLLITCCLFKGDYMSSVEPSGGTKKHRRHSKDEAETVVDRETQNRRRSSHGERKHSRRSTGGNDGK